MDRSDRKMLWLDTDIGTDIDDALTLSYLLGRPDVDILGISTVTVSAVERAKLAAAICHDMGQPNIRVFAGADRPLVHQSRQTEYPQTEAVDPSMTAQIEEQVAKTGAHIEAMYRAALRWPGEVHLLAIGPLTNLALLVRTHPDVADLLASVTLMAGRFYGPALPEWNVWCDPHAAAIVFESFKNVRSVGLDVTLKTTRPADDIWKVFRPAGPTVNRAIEIFIRKQKKERICLHDPLAAAAVVDDRVLQFEHGTVQVETEGNATDGVIVFRPKPDGPHRVAKEVDLERFCADYEQVLRDCRVVRQE
jgi:inosine-uridine nucleoside N-ribohydrolase